MYLCPFCVSKSLKYSIVQYRDHYATVQQVLSSFSLTVSYVVMFLFSFQSTLYHNVAPFSAGNQPKIGYFIPIKVKNLNSPYMYNTWFNENLFIIYSSFCLIISVGSLMRHQYASRLLSNLKQFSLFCHKKETENSFSDKINQTKQILFI